MKTNIVFVVLLLFGMAQISQAAIVGPYRADDFTLHLWNFDDAVDGNTPDAVTDNAIALALVGNPTLDVNSLPGHGKALQAGNGVYANGGTLPISQFTWSDGAFTFECLIRPDVDPLAPPNHMNIICGDNFGQRSWQFRINTAGALEFILLTGGVQSLTAPLPSTGPNAALQGQWYHIAATYNGREGEAGNLKLYWTLLDDTRTEANLLQEFAMQADLGGEPTFVVGTSGRNIGGESFRGLIDDVRISSLNRFANEMKFVDRQNVGPYALDGQTIHLWHFDEPAGSTTVEDSSAFTQIALTRVDPGTLGEPSLDGFGTALNTNNGGYVTAGPQPLDQFTGTNGAFTFEAIINSNVDPLAPLNHMNIICGDRGDAARSWQFRINTNGQLEFILITGGVQSLTAPLPDSGPNAAVAGQWYHVAATYNGNEGSDGNLKLYWTLIDKGKTEAALLAEFNMQADLGGEPTFVIGTNDRNAGGEFFRGLIDEVRISNLDRLPDEMLFTGEGSDLSPAFTVHPEDTLVGLGETLKLQALVSGAFPMTFQWQFNDVNLPGETSDTLTVADIDYADEGTYRVIATNEHGSAVSNGAYVTVGATFSELFNTGAGDDETQPDPHYFLIDSNDLTNLGPDAYPIARDPDTWPPFPSFVLNSDTSMWIGPTVDVQNVVDNPSGRYAYFTSFVIDSLDPNTAVLEGKWTMNTQGTDLLLNGQSTGITNMNADAFRGFENFTITEGFLPGINTLEFVIDHNAVGNFVAMSGFRVELRGVGLALPEGLPTIVTQPTDTTVRTGGKTTLSVVAQGRPPLSYQWSFNGSPLDDATSRTLTLTEAEAADAGSYSVEVTNASGTTPSEAATLTVTSDNQAPVAPVYQVTTLQDEPVDISIANLKWNVTDPDGDLILFFGVDATGSQGGTIVDPGGAFFTYTPPAGFTGIDTFTYTVRDDLGAELIGNIEVNVTQP